MRLAHPPKTRARYCADERSSVDPTSVITTVTAHGPLQDPVTFRAVVLAWLLVVSGLLVAARPVLLDLIDLVWALRRSWHEHSPPVGEVDPGEKR